MRDPYSVLGVPRNADADAIRKAYKKLARQWHPDVNQSEGAEERFKEVNAAYDILGDEDKRKNFDRYGEASTRTGFDPRAGGGGFDFGGGVNVDDLLGSLFGSGGRAGPRRGRDQTLQIGVDLLTVVRGGKRSVSVRRPDGRTETLDVPIPAGARDGGKVRLRGQGLPPRGGGPCGDLLVQLKVQSHPLLRRLDDDIEMDVPITILEALQGASITVPTPTGDVRLKVPPGARSGTRMRLRGRGVQRKGRPGDLYLVLRPEVPAQASDEAIEAAKALEEAYDDDVRKGLSL